MSIVGKSHPIICSGMKVKMYIQLEMNKFNFCKWILLKKFSSVAGTCGTIVIRERRKENFPVSRVSLIWYMDMIWYMGMD